MNIQTCYATGKSPYSLVFGQDLVQHFSILEDLYQRNIMNEEELPDDFFENSKENNPPTIKYSPPSTIEHLSSSTIEYSPSSTIEYSPPSTIEYSSSNTIEHSLSSTIEHLLSRTIEHSLSSPIETSSQNLTKPSSLRLNEHLSLLSQQGPSSELLQNNHNEKSNVKKNKHQLEYAINEYVCIAIPKIDRNSINQHTLPCKVIEELPNKMYHLQCKNGILDVTFNANELMPLGPTKYEELEICENNVTSIREAARIQSMSIVTGVYCNCKSECKNNNCKCKRA
ncbi:5613_t:CDS:2, partial [Racocetra persica]